MVSIMDALISLGNADYSFFIGCYEIKPTIVEQFVAIRLGSRPVAACRIYWAIIELDEELEKTDNRITTSSSESEYRKMSTFNIKPWIKRAVLNLYCELDEEQGQERQGVNCVL